VNVCLRITAIIWGVYFGGRFCYRKIFFKVERSSWKILISHGFFLLSFHNNIGSWASYFLSEIVRKAIHLNREQLLSTELRIIENE